MKVTAAAAATAKTDAPTKPIGANCDNCGYEIRAGGHNCPAQNEKCRKCRSVGHFKSVCKAKISAIYVSQVSSAKDDTVTVSIKARGTHNPVTEVRTLPDTGSTLDAIPPSVYHRQFQDVPLDIGGTATKKTSVASPKPQPAITSNHSDHSKLKLTGKPTMDYPDQSSQLSMCWKPCDNQSYQSQRNRD